MSETPFNPFDSTYGDILLPINSATSTYSLADRPPFDVADEFIDRPAQRIRTGIRNWAGRIPYSTVAASGLSTAIRRLTYGRNTTDTRTRFRTNAYPGAPRSKSRLLSWRSQR